jgi:hypothetical protein
MPAMMRMVKSMVVNFWFATIISIDVPVILFWVKAFAVKDFVENRKKGQ